MSADLTLFDGERRCTVCGDPLPAGSRRQRRFCSGRCRVAHQRGAPDYERPADAPRETVTSKPTDEHDPASARVDRDFGPSMSTPTPEPAATAPRQPLAAIAAGIATPTDGHGMARAYCEVRAGGFGVVFGRDAGRVHEPVGPVFPRPRQAIDLAELLNARLIAA